MEILNLTLSNFRNFSGLKVIFDRHLTVITGPNGSGKSNILEATALLSGVKSSRVETDLDLVKFGKGEAKVEASINYQLSSILAINFQVVDELHVKKAYFIDSIKKRLVDFVDVFSVVEFTPLDLDLVVGSPSLRRHHLDVLLSALDRDYWRAISAYNKVVVRRNRVLLRILEHQSKPSELDFWDERLLEHGSVVAQKRQEFFEFLNFVEPAFSKVSKETQKWLSGLKWVLAQSLLSEEKLRRNRERDIAAGMTLSGPHRDDFQFVFGDKNLEFFGSRGEQRMAVLALKLAELEFFAVKRGERPVLALDDIFSELDWEHREAVLSIVGKQQTIITAAERESLPAEIFKKAKVIRLG
ncbi:DNA replication and repair protein RecF [Candidatus Woesebacteria bacterium]|nr:DNA replication and repair protein RecF [Candidatus Woesebacteria bacterium]